MIINAQSLDLVFKGFNTIYTDAYMNADQNWDKLAMQVPSISSEETYGWMGQFPQLREWIGPRHVHDLEAHDFKIKNRKFESTVRVKRDHVSDVKPMMLVVPPDLEEAALKIVNTDINDGGGTNPWSKTAELVVTPYLAA